MRALFGVLSWAGLSATQDDSDSYLSNSNGVLLAESCGTSDAHTSSNTE